MPQRRIGLREEGCEREGADLPWPDPEFCRSVRGAEPTSQEFAVMAR